MKKQNGRQSNGNGSESAPLKGTGATTSRPVQRAARELSNSSDNALDRIRARAYHLFELRGRQPGHGLEDWLQAEREILSSDGASELVRAQAYRLFELRGRQPGHAQDDWLQAERQILRPSASTGERRFTGIC